MSWGLPETVYVGGEERPVHHDYRDILYVIGEMGREDAQQGALNALYSFYENFEAIPTVYFAEAWEALCAFIRCGAPEDMRPSKAHKLIDWEQDELMIAADMNKVAGCEVRALPYLHWYTFMGYFSAIGEGQLSTVVSIRSKKAKGKKLEKWEQDYYRENRDRVDLARPGIQAEQEEKAALLDRLR